MDIGGSMFDRLEVETPMCPKSFELAMLGLETDTGMVIKPQNEPKHIAVAWRRANSTGKVTRASSVRTFSTCPTPWGRGHVFQCRNRDSLLIVRNMIVVSNPSYRERMLLSHLSRPRIQLITVTHESFDLETFVKTCRSLVFSSLSRALGAKSTHVGLRS